MVYEYKVVGQEKERTERFENGICRYMMPVNAGICNPILRKKISLFIILLFVPIIY